MILWLPCRLWSRKFGNLHLLNSAYITLLPRQEDAACVKDFRPISLVHSFAKLVTKLMANRLAGRPDQMVSSNQHAFIEERFIWITSCWYSTTQKFCINKSSMCLDEEKAQLFSPLHPHDVSLGGDLGSTHPHHCAPPIPTSPSTSSPPEQGARSPCSSEEGGGGASPV